MGKKYVVRLSEEEREQLRSLVKKGTVKAYRVKHANILLKADANGPGWTDQRIAEAFGCHSNTVVYVRQRLVEEGLERALGRKKQQRPSRAMDKGSMIESQLIWTAVPQKGLKIPIPQPFGETIEFGHHSPYTKSAGLSPNVQSSCV